MKRLAELLPIAFLLLGCSVTRDQSESFKSTESVDSKFVLLELKDPRKTLTGINAISIDFEEKKYSINDHSKSFVSCQTDADASLRLICLMTDSNDRRHEEEGTQTRSGDNCSKHSISEFLRKKRESSIVGDTAISGIVVCSDDLWNPTTRISAVIANQEYVAAIYVDNFDRGTAVQQQAFIALGNRLKVKDIYRIDSKVGDRMVTD